MVTAAKMSLLKSGFVTVFLDPEIKTFSRLYSKTITVSFSRLRVIKIGDRKKAGTKINTFFMIQTYAQKQKQISLYLHLPHFFQIAENCWAKFKRLFQELETLCEPWKWICIFSNFGAFIPFWRNVKYWWISLELISCNSTQKKIVVAYLIPP